MLFLTPADVRALDARGLRELLGRRDAVVAAGEGEVGGIGAAALLFADYAVVSGTTTLDIDHPEAWAGAAWRIGRAALRLYLSGRTRVSAVDARDAGLVDEVTGADLPAWLEGWMRNRSPLALDSAAMLIRSRGGDVLERAEFARLFAIGEPQKGLGAFLAKSRAF